MNELFRFLIVNHPILSILFVGSIIVELVCLIAIIFGYVKSDKSISRVGIIILVSMAIMAISGHKLGVAEHKLRLNEAQDTSYTQAIENMSEGQWYDAAIAFNNAGTIENAEILRDYCYYIYLSDEHPDWVPWMGLNEITGNCN